MSLTKIITYFVLIAILGTGGYLAFKSGKKLPVTGDVASTTGSSFPMTNSKKKAFTEFMKEGGSYKCTVNQYVENMETKGIVYLNDGMIRGEYTSRVQGLDIGTNVIVRDGFTYSWSSMTPTMGFKAKATQAGTTNYGTDGKTSDAYSFNAEQIGDYDCQAWTADPAVFTLPTGVSFQEI